MGFLKDAFFSISSEPAVARLWSRSMANSVAVFTLHRLESNGGGSNTVGLDTLDQILTKLAQHRIVVDSLYRTITDINSHPDNIRPRVVFTVDDGYTCFADAADVFESHGFSATLFATTDFVSADDWMWWDKIEYILKNRTKDKVCIEHGENARLISFGADESLNNTARQFLEEYLKTVSSRERQSVIEQCAEQAGVVLPDSAPPEYRALNWSQLKGLHERGFEIAPHTVSHPILLNEDSQNSERQIVESYRVMQKHFTPTPVFAYPNGTEIDFGTREMNTVRDLGLAAAVSTSPGYISSAMLTTGSDSLFSLPRFYCPNNVQRAVAIATGLRKYIGMAA